MQGTYYELLGIKPTASPEEIKDAYKANIAKYHPDHNKAPNAHQMAVWLNAAYETLRDPGRRAEYDLSIGIANKSEPGQPPKRETRAGDQSQKEAEWRRQKEAEEAERRRRRAEAERRQRDEAAARQRAAAEAQRKAQEAAHQRAVEEERQKQEQAAESLRQLQIAGAARIRTQRMLLAVGAIIIGILIFRTLTSSSNSISNEKAGVAPTEQTTPLQVASDNIKALAAENQRTIASPIPKITYEAVRKPVSASATASGQSPAPAHATPGPADTSPGVRQSAEPVTDSSNAAGCNERTITQVSDEGATVTLSDGSSYAVSTSYMRIQASGWSTGDSVVLCRSGTAASIANQNRYNEKIQAVRE
ncbi:MAG TPA: J domain-containing protein [Candidatus Cybelea sp.]